MATEGIMDNSPPNPIKDYYIAYFDILGYKDFFKTEPDKVQEFLQRIHEVMIRSKNRIAALNHSPLASSVGKMNISVKIFSDNVVLCMEALDEPIEPLRILDFLQVVADLQRVFVAEYGLFVRGGIRKGPISISPDYVFGQGLIDVVEMEKEAQFPRIIINDVLVNTLTSKQLFSQEDVEEAIRIRQLLNEGKQISTEGQEFYSKVFIANAVLSIVMNQIIIQWTDGKYILNYLYALDITNLLSEQFLNYVLATLKTQSPFDYALATLPSPSLDSILQRHKEKVEEQLKKWGSNTDIQVGDTKAAEEREKVLRKYVWSMAFHNMVCQKYDKMNYFISTQCNCDTRFVKMTIKVLNDEG